PPRAPLFPYTTLFRSQDLERVHVHLDLARGQVGVHVLRRPGHHIALDGDDGLGPEMAGALEHVRRGPVGAERELDAPGAVSQIDEDEAAEVAAAVDPAGEADAVAGVFTAQRACQRAAQRGGQAMAHGIRENVTGYLTGPGCSGAFRVAQGTQEVIGIARGDEPLADLVPADEPGDAAERLDVRARGGFRADEHEEQL